MNRDVFDSDSEGDEADDVATPTGESDRDNVGEEEEVEVGTSKVAADATVAGPASLRSAAMLSAPIAPEGGAARGLARAAMLVAVAARTRSMLAAQSAHSASSAVRAWVAPQLRSLQKMVTSLARDRAGDAPDADPFRFAVGWDRGIGRREARHVTLRCTAAPPDVLVERPNGETKVYSCAAFVSLQPVGAWRSRQGSRVASKLAS